MHVLINTVNNFIHPLKCVFSFECHTQRCKLARPLPDLPPEIWLEIFQFASYIHRSATIVPLDPFALKRTSNNAMAANTPVLAMRTKLALVLVNRSWRRIAVQMLYQHPVIRSPTRAKLLLSVFEASRQGTEPDSHVPRVCYGEWTRHLEVYTHAPGTKSIQYLQHIFRICQLCPNLRILSGHWFHLLPIEFLNGLSKLYGPSLQGLYWNEHSPRRGHIDISVASPEFLASFTALQSLDLRHFVGVDLSERSQTSLPKPTLSFVKDLIISTHDRSVSAATFLCLPALRNLTIKTSINDRISPDLLLKFLKVHGTSLITVDLPSPSPDSEPEPDTSQSRRTAPHVNPDVFLQPTLCPNLTSLTYPITSPPLAPHVHTSLRQIGLRGVRADGLYPDKSTITKSHLTSITRNKYPNLEMVRTVGFLVDADTDGLIKDIFIWWVEKFERQDIDFLDGEGVLWAYSESDSEENNEPNSGIVHSKSISEPKCDKEDGKDGCRCGGKRSD